MWLGTLKDVSLVSKWKRNTKDHMGYCNHWKSRSGNGSISRWISWQICPRPWGVMIRYGWWWTKLTKSTHFLAMRETLSMEKLAKPYVNEVISRHGVPLSIISDRDSRLTPNFWNRLQKELGTRLNLSTTCYPQTDGQSKWSIQTLKDIIFYACKSDKFGDKILFRWGEL